MDLRQEQRDYFITPLSRLCRHIQVLYVPLFALFQAVFGADFDIIAEVQLVADHHHGGLWNRAQNLSAHARGMTQCEWMEVGAYGYMMNE